MCRVATTDLFSSQLLNPATDYQICLAHQVRDAHGISTSLALAGLGINLANHVIVGDRLSEIKKAFSGLLSSCDVVITTGGISVGKHDLLHDVVKPLKLKQIFYKITQKPGKPMAFGKRGNKLWFALPGNPVSALFCFYYYVQPALKKMKS